MAVGRWWKFTSDQLHDGSRTEAQSAKTFKKGILGFLYSSFLLLLPSGRPRGGPSLYLLRLSSTFKGFVSIRVIRVQKLTT